MGRIGSGVWVSASFQKNACFMGRVGSGVEVSDSFHILSCVVVCAVRF